MGTNWDSEPPLVCTLSAGEFRERLDWTTDLNRAGLLDARRDGRYLVLTYRADQADRVREMIRQESQCCGFLGYDLAEARETLILTITAPDSAADILDAIFDPFTGRAEQAGACGCASGPLCMGDNNDSH